MSNEPARQLRPRVTIADIAMRAGVSKGAVSYALNDRPGLSDATRRRILAIAEDLGWHPNSAARALSAARAGACGLVLARPERTPGFGTFFMDLVAGIAGELSPRSVGLTLQVVPDLAAEVAVYRQWWAERRVDGVLVVDLREDDPRIAELEVLGLPAVVVGGPDGIGALSAVWSDDAGSVDDVVRYLAGLGHERIARVAGTSEYHHNAVRTAAFLQVMAELALDPVVVATDYLAESGARATRELLATPRRPTAIVYDNDLLAVAGLGAAQEAGFRVPEDVSIVAWDDSFYCQVVVPALTTYTRDVTAHGAHAAAALLALLDGGEPVLAAEPPGAITPRGSTAPPGAPSGTAPPGAPSGTAPPGR